MQLTTTHYVNNDDHFIVIGNKNHVLGSQSDRTSGFYEGDDFAEEPVNDETPSLPPYSEQVQSNGHEIQDLAKHLIFSVEQYTARFQRNIELNEEDGELKKEVARVKSELARVKSELARVKSELAEREISDKVKIEEPQREQGEEEEYVWLKNEYAKLKKELKTLKSRLAESEKEREKEINRLKASHKVEIEELQNKRITGNKKAAKVITELQSELAIAKQEKVETKIHKSWS